MPTKLAKLAKTGNGPALMQTIPELLALRQRTILDGRVGMPLEGGASAYVEWRMPKNAPYVEILHMADVQWGSRFCREDKARQYFDWVLQDPWRFVTLGGDLVEAYNYLKSPGTPYEQIADPYTCLGSLLRVLMPVAHRVLGCVSGNHERRHIALTDLTRMIAELLQVPWAPGRQHIALNYSRWQPFKIAMHHGRGNAQTRGGVVNILEKLAKMDDSDLFFMGHLHQSNVIHITRNIWNPERRAIEFKDSWAAMGSHFQNHWGSYADVAGMVPSKLSMPLARLERNGEWRVVLHGL